MAMPILSGGGEGSEERHLGDSSCILKMTKCSSCRLGWGWGGEAGWSEELI